MKTDPHDWHGVAMAKLGNVLGARLADETSTSVLRELGLVTITSPAELRDFARILTTRGGFAGTVGTLLSVHATIHGG